MLITSIITIMCEFRKNWTEWVQFNLEINYNKKTRNLNFCPNFMSQFTIYYVGRYIGHWKYEPILVCSKEKYYHECNSWIAPVIYLSLWLGLFILFFVLVCDKGTIAWFING